MSITTLHEVSTEIRRLSIAGAGLAPGDFRLQKLIKPLEKSGAKSPVFVKVAQSVKSLVESNEKEASKALLELSTLINAILYTQGRTGVEGTLEFIETSPVQGTTTKTTYRVLSPLISALTETGQGRFEVVKDAVERGAFKDVRLIQPSIQALGDRYGELATLVAEKVLPEFGRGIIPLLKKDLDPKGGVIHARKLRALAKIDPLVGRETARELIDEANKEVRIAAIEALQGSEDDIEIILKMTDAKIKDVRRSAFRALAGIEDNRAHDVFKKAFQTANLEIVAETVGENLSDQLVAPLVSEGERILELVSKNKSPDEKTITRLRQVLQALAGNMNKKAEAFLLTLFEHRQHFSGLRKNKVHGEGLNEDVALLISTVASKTAKQILIKNRDSLPASQFWYAFLSSAAVDPPSKVHKAFSPFLRDKNKGNAIQNVILRNWYQLGHYYHNEIGQFFWRSVEDITWHPDWLKSAIKADSPSLVCELIKPSDAAAIKYLKSRINDDPADDSNSQILGKLIEVEAKDVTKLTLACIAKAFSKRQNWYAWRYLYLIPLLPTKSLPEVEAFIKKLPDKHIDDALPYLAELKEIAAKEKK